MNILFRFNYRIFGSPGTNDVIKLEDLLRIDITECNTDDIVQINVDFIKKCENKIWKHEHLSLKGQLSPPQAMQWNERLKQALVQAQGIVHIACRTMK